MAQMNYYKDRVVLNVLGGSVENARACYEAGEGHVAVGVLTADYPSVEADVEAAGPYMDALEGNLSVGLGGGNPAQWRAVAEVAKHVHANHFNQAFCAVGWTRANHARAGDIGDVKRLAGRDTCAVLLELIQGEGGVIALDRDFVKAVSAFCVENDILLIVDEVQTGVGRTGKFYAYQNYGVLPDIVTSAKGLAGGLPIGAVLLGEKCRDALGAGEHGSTFGANPVCCAGGLAVMERLTDGFLEEVAETGEHFRKRLLNMPGVKGVSGLGLMIGVEIEGITARDTANACLERGLLVLTAKDRVRLLPPLTIDGADIDAGLDILQDVLGGLAK